MGASRNGGQLHQQLLRASLRVRAAQWGRGVSLPGAKKQEGGLVLRAPATAHTAPPLTETAHCSGAEPSQPGIGDPGHLSLPSHKHQPL